MVIPADTELYRQLYAAAMTHRCLVFVGLPGIGKSLLTRQASLIARHAHRPVTLLQWDVVRRDGFEIAPFIARYPERDGVTHPVVRLAVDCWLRRGIGRWLAESGDDALLLIEAPLLGGRLTTLLHQEDDAAETLLDQALFLLPVPTTAVKDALRGKRSDSKNADPGQADASVDVLDVLVDEINAAGVALGLAQPGARGYEPETYAAVFRHAMRHRKCRTLRIDTIFAPRPERASEAPARLQPSPDEVALAFAQAEAIPASARSQHADEWYL